MQNVNFFNVYVQFIYRIRVLDLLLHLMIMMMYSLYIQDIRHDDECRMMKLNLLTAKTEHVWCFPSSYYSEEDALIMLMLRS